MEGTNYDWGQYNAISNGNSEQAGLWRTLTSAEWSYLLGYPSDGRIVNGHSGAGYCYNILKVNSIWGLLIYPDGFTGQSDHSLSSNLAEVPEGCAFLPMAGRRDVNTIYGVNEWGYYWTSTTPGTLANPNTKAIAMRFNKNGNNINDIGERDKYNGYSVRLVQNVTSTQK